MIDVKNISYNYNNDHKIINNVNFHISPGQIVTFVGSSGSGKTTLFKLLTGILQPTEGVIHLSGNFIPSHMTQNDLLLPWETVLNNILLPFELGKKHFVREEVTQKAKELLLKVGLKDYASYYPNELSGGMRQRVSLLRALITDSPLLLLDEPFSSLDYMTKESIYELIKQLHQERNMTVLLVTHDFRDALTLSDKIFFLDKGTITKEWKVDRQKIDDPPYSIDLLNSIKKAYLPKNKKMG